MGPDPLIVLALAGSAGALLCSLVVMLRSTPQRVRKAAYAAVEIAEETQNGFRTSANRMISFMDEITREREISAGDLQEAERKRRQAAAKLSAMDKKKANGADADTVPPKTLGEMLAEFPIGDPRRITILRQAKMMMGEDHS